MGLDLEAKQTPDPKGAYDYDPLDLSQLDIVIDVQHIEQFPNEQYALLRKHGLGTSDSSIVCGVNPYTTTSELIQEKARDFLTADEKAVGDKTAVRKGRDLEPVIIQKHSEIIGKRIIKPSDMYRHKDFPWLKFNFDGVIDKFDLGNGRYQYIPDEIKVVTKYGVKHYDPTKAFYRERLGFMNTPEDHSKENNSIVTKAAEYGIPPYYYTQLQQQIFGLDAEFGYLTVLFDDTWELVSFMVYRDDATINQIITNGYKIWQQICKLSRDPNRADTTALQAQFRAMDNLPSEPSSKSAYSVIDETQSESV